MIVELLVGDNLESENDEHLRPTMFMRKCDIHLLRCKCFLNKQEIGCKQVFSCYQCLLTLTGLSASS